MILGLKLLQEFLLKYSKQVRYPHLLHLLMLQINQMRL